MANKPILSKELIDALEEIYPHCIFEEQARKVLLARGYTVAKSTWADWKARGGELLYSEDTDDRELSEYEELLIRFFIVLNNIGTEIDQVCLDNISAQLRNPKNSEFNWRVLKLRNRGEYDEKAIVEQQVSGSLDINAGSLLDMIKQIKMAENKDDQDKSL